MDWNILLGNLFEIFGSTLCIFLIAVINIYLVPWLKEKQLYSLIKNLMASVEEKYKKMTGAEKKQWVLDQLDQLEWEYNKELVSKLIDGFTKELTAEGILNTERKVE